MAEPTPINKAQMHNWPGIAKVAKLLSLPIKKVNQLVADGDLRAHDYNNERRFNPVDIEDLRKDLLEVKDDEDTDVDVITARTKNESMVLHTITDVLREVRSQQRETNEQNILLQKQAANAWKSSSESKDKTIEWQGNRIAQLEEEQANFIRLREEMLDAREDREMLRDRARTRNKITEDIWQTTKSNFSDLVAAAMSKWGIDHVSMKKLKAAQQLLQSVAATPTRLEVLIETGLVSEEEAAWIREILGEAMPSSSASASTATSTESSAPASSQGSTESSSSTDSSEPQGSPGGTVIDVEVEPDPDPNNTQTGDTA